MITANSTEPDPGTPARSIVITSLEHNSWQELEQGVTNTLERLQCLRLLDSTLLLLHKVITNMIKTMHRHAFHLAIERDLSLDITNKDSMFDELLQNELSTHGDRNIEQFCKKHHFQITLTFPREKDTLLQIDYPESCDSSTYLDNKLAKAIGFTLIRLAKNEGTSEYCSARIMRNMAKHPHHQAQTSHSQLLSQIEESDKAQAIFCKLGHGIMVFSSAGDILSISPAILDNLKLEVTPASTHALSNVIPGHFYNDVLWGLALESEDGLFENYRIRIRMPHDNSLSILFNVSGYRHHDMTIHTLWQVVSLDLKTTHTLAEGSILNEARVHNITRNYVPQLIEQKAREVVRLGGNALPNEECWLAILFCDIAGFTSYVENNEKEESVIHTLNLILGRITKAVRQHDGIIDKFMGDCVMALFKEPHKAVLAALEIHKHSYDFNNLRMRAGKDLLLLRIGIHWGKVVIGNVGSADRLDWTTIGDAVNTAARLEKNCGPGAILVSETLYKTITLADHPEIRFSKAFQLELKGKRNKETVRYIQTDNQSLLHDTRIIHAKN
ncbi:adenylate/guanylate cyclase domain-containing protein [Nitrosomonas sp.]|uniref:adenylate/guanylate cyclase domain-containing protein n=1 Tax=Nitrosomonas sp. TaxID=42353 RepID=UPI0025EAF6A5|nr:adenylate/guanylate cyclase domain-containing protein [Nitrosomonas sp.]